MSTDTVGSLLAAIATFIGDGLRILSYADKSQWGPDEHEQQRLLEETLDDAKKDFQELSLLVSGQLYYQNDRKPDSLDDLRIMRMKYDFHIQNFKDWARSGGPINSIWAKETADLRRELHRAQCRAARRIFAAEQESSARCLGAFLVYRKQREWTHRVLMDEAEYQQRHLEELATCNTVGKFERFGDRDIAFVCDFCDGHIVWDDLENMPSMRAAQEYATEPVSPISPTTLMPHWQATGFAVSDHAQKTIVFAPIAIANHVAPSKVDWMAKLLCPYCDQLPDYAPGDEDMEDGRALQDESGFEDLQAMQEHLEWQHTAVSLPVSLQALPSATSNCQVM